MAKQNATHSATKQESVPLFKYGDQVRILHSADQRGRIVELRGPLGPGGVQVYRLRILGRLKPTYAEVREDQLTTMPVKNAKKTRHPGPATKVDGVVRPQGS